MALRDIFRSSYKKDDDRREALHYLMRYGAQAVERLESRVQYNVLDERDRRHWCRILKEVKRLMTDRTVESDG